MQNRIAQFSRLSLLAFAVLFASANVQASVQPTTKKTVKKSPSKKKTSKKPAAEAVAADDDVPNTAEAMSTDFHCEAGNKLTIYNHPKDEQHVAMRWKNRLLQLTKVDTSTGADRFESSKHGLVWIGIPAKGILLDAKKGMQLANECKSAAQLNPAIAAPAGLITPASPANSTTPASPATSAPPATSTAPAALEQPTNAKTAPANG